MGGNMFQQWEAKHLMISVFVSLSGQQGLSGARLGDQGTTAQTNAKLLCSYCYSSQTRLACSLVPARCCSAVAGKPSYQFWREQPACQSSMFRLADYDLRNKYLFHIVTLSQPACHHQPAIFRIFQVTHWARAFRPIQGQHKCAQKFPRFWLAAGVWDQPRRFCPLCWLPRYPCWSLGRWPLDFGCALRLSWNCSGNAVQMQIIPSGLRSGSEPISGSPVPWLEKSPL